MFDGQKSDKAITESIFANNVGFYGLSDEEISKKTGIGVGRVKQLSAGEEPVISELIAMAKVLDGSVESILKGSWLKYRFGDYYRPDNDFLKKVLEKAQLDEIYFVFSSGFLVRAGDDIKFTNMGKVFEKCNVDSSIVMRAIDVLIENGFANAAVDISTKTIFLQADTLESIDAEVLKKYLFIQGRGSVYRHFEPFFNRLKNEDDKETILAMIRDNLNGYMTNELIKDDNFVYYITLKNGFQSVSPPWIMTDLTGLETNSVIKQELIELQKDLFKERG